MVNLYEITNGYDTNKVLLHRGSMDRGGIPIRKGGSPAEKSWEPLTYTMV